MRLFVSMLACSNIVVGSSQFSMFSFVLSSIPSFVGDLEYSCTRNIISFSFLLLFSHFLFYSATLYFLCWLLKMDLIKINKSENSLCYAWRSGTLPQRLPIFVLSTCVRRLCGLSSQLSFPFGVPKGSVGIDCSALETRLLLRLLTTS